MVNKLGRYKTKRYYTGLYEHGSWAIIEGTEFEVTEINEKTNSFFSTVFRSWRNCDIDVEFIGD